jgi:hypothetical protein
MGGKSKMTTYALVWIAFMAGVLIGMLIKTIADKLGEFFED